jgi:hypothetical protein
MQLEVIPVGLMNKDKSDDVVAFIRDLPIDPMDRKRLLVQWCKMVGAALTRDMVERANAG